LVVSVGADHAATGATTFARVILPRARRIQEWRVQLEASGEISCRSDAALQIVTTWKVSRHVERVALEALNEGLLLLRTDIVGLLPLTSITSTLASTLP